MDELKKAAIAFQHLLDVQYKIILGKKGRLTSLLIGFEKADFFHLIGLQYLHDMPQLKKSREKIFDKIIAGELAQQHISNSVFYEDIAQRIKDFTSFESIMDSNELVFMYAHRKSSFSKINAKYLLKTVYRRRTNYIFVDEAANRERMFCKSFFFNDSNDYTQNQISMTLLYKEKIYLNGSREIQLNKLK